MIYLLESLPLLFVFLNISRGNFHGLGVNFPPSLSNFLEFLQIMNQDPVFLSSPDRGESGWRKVQIELWRKHGSSMSLNSFNKFQLQFQDTLIFCSNESISRSQHFLFVLFEFSFVLLFISHPSKFLVSSVFFFTFYSFCNYFHLPRLGVFKICSFVCLHVVLCCFEFENF